MGDSMMGEEGGEDLLFLVGVVVVVVAVVVCIWRGCVGSAVDAVEDRLHAPPDEDIFNRRVLELLRRKKRSVPLSVLLGEADIFWWDDGQEVAFGVGCCCFL